MSDYLSWLTPRIGLSLPGYAKEIKKLVIELENTETIYEEIKANFS